MTRERLSESSAALLGGALCLAILGGMIAGHAWPLWTGEPIEMHVLSAATDHDRRGEHVALRLPENLLYLGTDPGSKDAAGALTVRAGDGLWMDASDRERRRRLRGAIVYLQIEPDAYGVWRGVSVTGEPMPGARNLRGRIVQVGSGDVYRVEYGIESLFVQEGRAAEIRSALNANKGGRVEVALTGSGRARARALLVGDRRW